MTTGDRELQRLTEEWQATEVPGVPPDRIRDYVRQRSRLLALWIASEAIVGVAGLTFILYLVVVESDRVHQVLMLALALAVVALLAFDAWNWRGTLRASAEDTATFLTLSMERLGRFRRAIRMSWLFLAVQVVVFTPWIWYRLYGREVFPTVRQQVFAWGLLIGLSVAAAVWTLLVTRWVKRDRQVLEGLARELTSE